MDRELFMTVTRGDADAVRRLLDQGADVNARDTTGTLLTWAVREAMLDVVRLLLERGADPNLVPVPDPKHARDCCKWPLMVAAAKGDGAMIRLLLQHGADIWASTDAGTTAMGWAARCRQTEAIQILRQVAAE